jgi:hypothetical protein
MSSHTPFAIPKNNLFISSRLQHMGGGPQGSSSLPFKFIPVFNVPEFRSEDIERNQREALAVFSKYASITRVPVYARLVTQYDKYFQPRDETGGRFVAGNVQPLDPQLLSCIGQEITVRSEETRMLALCANLIVNRDYEALINHLDLVNEKNVLFPLFAILMGDIRFLRVTGRVRRLYEVVRLRLQRERTKRFDAEANPVISSEARDRIIQDCVENEIHLLLGVVLLIAYDSEDIEA